jgi:hypothetical protein
MALLMMVGAWTVSSGHLVMHFVACLLQKPWAAVAKQAMPLPQALQHSLLLLLLLTQQKQQQQVWVQLH